MTPDIILKWCAAICSIGLTLLLISFIVIVTCDWFKDTFR